MGMLAIDLRLGDHLSIRQVRVDGSTGYSCPVLAGETELEMLQRRMVVTLAGLAWEEFSSVRQTLSEIIRAQHDDRRAALAIIKYARRRYMLAGPALRKWLTQAWELARRILNEKNAAIMKVAEFLAARGTLQDSELRYIVATAALES
jgi:hypothetical protein